MWPLTSDFLDEDFLQGATLRPHEKHAATGFVHAPGRL
jgi:hypothetical protein